MSYGAASTTSAITFNRAESDRLRRNAMLFLFGFVAFLLLISHNLLNDPDSFWHIRVGEYIWRTGSFPQVDYFSHTFSGEPWIAKEWLSQTIFYLVYEYLGWKGLVDLAIIVISSSFAYLFYWLSHRIRMIWALAIAIFCASLTAGQFLARPHIFFFPLLILFVTGLIGAIERRERPSWWLVLLMALWANLHASFTIGFAILGILAAEAVLTAPTTERIRTFRRWLLFSLATVAAVGATPYGYKSAWVTVMLFGSGEAVKYINEWQPLKPDALGAMALMGLLAALWVIAASKKINPFRLLLILLCAYLMVRHVRFQGLFGIVAAISVSDMAAQRFARLRPHAASTSPREQSLQSAVLTGLMIGSVGLAIIARPVPNALINPVAALDAARRHGVTGPVYNDYNFGGFLISQGVKTFIDGRSDQLFVNGFMDGLYGALDKKDEKPFLALLDRHKVTWALVVPDLKAAGKLGKSSGWKRIYQDKTAIVFVRSRPLAQTGGK